MRPRNDANKTSELSITLRECGNSSTAVGGNSRSKSRIAARIAVVHSVVEEEKVGCGERRTERLPPVLDWPYVIPSDIPATSLLATNHPRGPAPIYIGF
jgi:hypothetical protein